MLFAPLKIFIVAIWRNWRVFARTAPQQNEN